MHYGVPCACSKTSSLGEIGQNAANLFDPADVEDISKALHDILTSEQSQARLIEAGRKRARDFSWTRHAATMTDIYHQRNNRK